MGKEFSAYKLFMTLTKNYDQAYKEFKETLNEKQVILFDNFLKAMTNLKTFECEDSYRMGQLSEAIKALKLNVDDEDATKETERYIKLKELYKELCPEEKRF
ncbi:MAG: hypothetical protein IJR55_03855 [Clostridia bacterium]|nr:hypothetical protein [Clostridia bacterium]